MKTNKVMERVTQKILNNAIERFNTMECLNGKEVYESGYYNKPRLFLNDKKTNSSLFIFEGTKSQCWSHPTWVRGLKQRYVLVFGKNSGRILHGCVD